MTHLFYNLIISCSFSSYWFLVPKCQYLWFYSRDFNVVLFTNLVIFFYIYSSKAHSLFLIKSKSSASKRPFKYLSHDILVAKSCVALLLNSGMERR